MSTDEIASFEDDDDIEQAPASVPPRADDPHAPPPAAPPPPLPSRADDFIPPAGIESLLDAHLGEALKIMRDFSTWIHHPKSDMEQCIHVSHAIGSLMTSSAKLAKLAVELRNGPAESRHRVIVERAGEGGGSAKAENE